MAGFNNIFKEYFIEMLVPVWYSTVWTCVNICEDN